MKEFSLNIFQTQVEEVLIRHKSILDILTKLQDSSARINRAVAKSVTYCGCIEIHGCKQSPPQDIEFSQLNQYMENHIKGSLCDVCKEKIEQELASNIFYLTALCNLLDVNLEQLLANHQEQLKALGKYGLL